MVKVTSNVEEVAAAYLKRVEQQAEDAVVKAMHKTGLVGEARVKGIMEKEAYDTGALLRSVTHKVRKSKDEVVLTIGSNLEYAWFVEHGRRPGKFPNLDALTKWVGRMLAREGVKTRVNVTFDQLKELARSKGKKASAQQKAYRIHLGVIYLVGRKIATKGIRGKMIFKRIENGLLAYFRAELSKELKTAHT